MKALKAGPRVDYTKLTIPRACGSRRSRNASASCRDEDLRPSCEASHNNAVRSPFEPEGMNNLEGLLWPDTYKVSAEEDEIQVLKTMESTVREEGRCPRARASERAGARAVRHHQDRVADRVGGEDRRRPPADRVGDLQPARAGHAAADRRDADLRPRGPEEAHLVGRRQGDQLAVQHVLEQRSAADADRGGQRGLVAGRARAGPDATTSTTSSSTRRATTRSRRRWTSTSRTSSAPGRPASCRDHGGDARCRGDRRPGAPLALAGPAQHGVSRARPRLGLRRVRGA